MNVTFDGPNRLVILGPGTTSVDLAQLYSRWKDWVRTGENSKFLPFFSTTGGEPINAAAGTIVPLYLFLLDGARIRPQEADHSLTIRGGTLIGDGGSDPFANTLGAYQVRVRYEQPVQAIGYSTTGGGGASAEDVANAVRAVLGPELAALMDIARIHGLVAGQPLVVTDVSRRAGSIVQTVSEMAGVVTVERTA